MEFWLEQCKWILYFLYFFEGFSDFMHENWWDFAILSQLNRKCVIDADVFPLFSCSIWIWVSKCEKSKGVLPSKSSETRIWHKYFKEILGMNQFYRHRVYLLALHLVPSVNPTKVSKQITTFTLSHNIKSWIISAHWAGNNHLRPLKIVSQLLMLPISSKYSHYNRIVESFHSWIMTNKMKSGKEMTKYRVLIKWRLNAIAGYQKWAMIVS